MTHRTNHLKCSIYYFTFTNEGVNIMLKRIKMDRVKPQLSANLGVISMATGLNRSIDATSLLGDDFIWIERMKNRLTKDEIVCSQRMGVFMLKIIFE